MGAYKYGEIRPGRKPLKMQYIKIALFALGRAMQCASFRDPDIADEIRAWPDGLTVMFKVLPRGPRMAVTKEKNGLVFKGSTVSEADADLIIFFKNIENAFIVFSGQAGTAQAFAEHRMSLKGDLAVAMTFTRCLNIVQTYLYPKAFARLLFRRVPHIPFHRKMLNRAVIYLLGIPFGI